MYQWLQKYLVVPAAYLLFCFTQVSLLCTNVTICYVVQAHHTNSESSTAVHEFAARPCTTQFLWIEVNYWLRSAGHQCQLHNLQCSSLVCCCQQCWSLHQFLWINTLNTSTWLWWLSASQCSSLVALVVHQSFCSSLVALVVPLVVQLTSGTPPLLWQPWQLSRPGRDGGTLAQVSSSLISFVAIITIFIIMFIFLITITTSVKSRMVRRWLRSLLLSFSSSRLLS